MNSSANLTALKALSTRVIADGVIGNAMMIVMATWGICMSTSQVVTIFSWKPLRDMQQTLTINAAVADGLKALAYGSAAFKRLCLAGLGMDELIYQSKCMIWIWPVAFGTIYGLSSVLMLSLERLAVVATPIWYWKNKRKFSWVLTLISCVGSALSAMALFIGASSELIFLSCNLLSSTTIGYYVFLVHFQDATTGGIILVNCITGIMLIRRWRAAKKAKADMNEFKKRVQLNAIKAVFSVVALCLVSFFAGMILMALIQDFDTIKKAFYGPFWGCLQMMRGMFDFGLWLLFSKKYRQGFKAVFLKGQCWKNNQVSPVQIGMAANNRIVHGATG